MNDDLDEHEVVRAAVLCRQAVLDGHSVYQGHLRFWIELRQLRQPNQWFQDPGGLYLATYLDRTVDGYNPFRVLVALDAGFPPLADWTAWASRMETPAGWPHSRLQHLTDRLASFTSRPRGMRTYCQAMEAVYLAVHNPALVLRDAEALSA